MRVLAFFLLGIHLTSAATHTLQYFYTGTSGIENFPEFITVGLVDGQQIDYYDSNIKKAVQKAEWISGAVDPDYWNRNAQTYAAWEAPFKTNIIIAKSRFNQTGGVHSAQMMYGCEVDDDGTKRGHSQEGYDGEDFISLDMNAVTWIAANPQAMTTKVKWDANRAEAEQRKAYLENTCIEWLQKYVRYGKDTLERKVSPQVFLQQKSSSSPVSCLATGFHPKAVTISWKKNGEDHDEDVDLGQLLPNEDGTFQKTSTLRVSPEELKKNEFSCVVEHQGDTFRETLTDGSLPVGIIAGVIVAIILLVVIGVVLFKVLQKKKKPEFKAVNGSDDGSNNS